MVYPSGILTVAQKLRRKVRNNSITHAIQNGKGCIAMPQKKDTIDTVAQALGLSKTTVSRALSGKGRVSEDTRNRILSYIRQSGCQLRVPLPDGDIPRTHNLSLVIPYHFVQLDLPFLRKCMGGICSMAAQRGYDILLCYVDHLHTEQLERQLAAGKVDGVILSRTLEKDSCVELLKKYQTPFVVLGRSKDDTVLQVDNDQINAAAEMTRLLLQLGMKRIAHLSGNLNYTVNADRLTGYLQALEEAGIPIDQSMICVDIESDEKRLDSLEAVLECKPECLLCCDDTLAFSVLKDLRQRGIRVPEQIRVASLYDSELLLHAQPTVSAVQFDAAALGAAACRMLLDSLAGKTVPRRLVHGHQVILRESTK